MRRRLTSALTYVLVLYLSSLAFSSALKFGLKEGHNVLLLPTVAREAGEVISEQGGEPLKVWNVTLRGFVYKRLPTFKMPRWVRKKIDKILGGITNPADRDRADQRLSRFYIRGIPFRSFELKVLEEDGSGETLKTKKSSSMTGVIKNELQVRSKKSGGVLEYEIVLPDGDEHQIKGKWILPEPEGYSIVTDLDDTIKITEVNDRDRTLKNTFAFDHKVVDHANIMFQKWSETLHDKSPPTFHYVSGSPWHLLPEIQTGFIDQYKFPAGTMSFRDVSLFDGSIFSLGNDKKIFNYKVNTILNLGDRLPPARKLILVGDSTQADPEVYAKVAHQLGSDRVQCIFIREVSGVNLEEEKRLNSPERFRNAFEGLDVNKWHIFQHYTELQDVDIKGGKCRPPQSQPESQSESQSQSGPQTLPESQSQPESAAQSPAQSP
ncbi:hypothetical protein HK102_011951 [Quaeritorhiza haematococci]|nr:hypothetical protein HK102_011951 [Quaeritorhiza haematococci]